MLGFTNKKQKQEKSKVNNEAFEKLTEVLDTDSIDSIYPFSWIEKNHTSKQERTSLKIY
ncbi:TPA: hypothetical protein ACU2Z8_002670 [Staphylococcus aureus]